MNYDGKIYIVWDCKLELCHGMTIDKDKAILEVERLNKAEQLNRYKVTVMHDFAR